ncbi:hypothetical protein ES703_03259 [subsurface metagenome]
MAHRPLDVEKVAEEGENDATNHGPSDKAEDSSQDPIRPAQLYSGEGLAQQESENISRRDNDNENDDESKDLGCGIIADGEPIGEGGVETPGEENAKDQSREDENSPDYPAPKPDEGGKSER